MTTTFRADLVAGMKTMLDDYQALHGDLLRSTWRTRPPSFDVDLPAAWVGRASEQVAFRGQLRERLTGPQVFVVDRLTDNDETLHRFDTLIDGLLEHFSTYAHLVENTVWDRMTIEDDFEDGFWLVRFTFLNVSAMDGRP